MLFLFSMASPMRYCPEQACFQNPLTHWMISSCSANSFFFSSGKCLTVFAANKIFATRLDILTGQRRELTLIWFYNFLFFLIKRLVYMKVSLSKNGLLLKFRWVFSVVRLADYLRYSFFISHRYCSNLLLCTTFANRSGHLLNNTLQVNAVL